MELPITKPSKISYGDEIDFMELLDKLRAEGYNGFIRVTHASDEGYILFMDGYHVAASYGRAMKEEALEEIMKVADKTDTLIELFDLKRSQIDYLMDINRIYRIESVEKPVNEPADEPYFNPQEVSYRQPVSGETSGYETMEEPGGDRDKAMEEPEKPEKAGEIESTVPEPESVEEEGGGDAQIGAAESAEGEVPEPESGSAADEIMEEPEKPLSRDELMKKYGLRDIEEEEIERVLETYKGGAITDIDPERVEFTLMNKIKMSILGIPKIKGAEVIVFLDNSLDLSGRIKIMVEHEGKGLFSRIMGDSKEEENLKFHIMDIVEMELRKTFRDFPEIVDNFEVSIEIR